MWPRRARYVEAGNVLPAQRFRSLTRTQPGRGGIGILRRSDETRLHWARRVVKDKRLWPSRKAGAIPDERERSAAAAALRRFLQWRVHRGSDERHPFSELELGHRHGVCVVGAREDRR